MSMKLLVIGESHLLPKTIKHYATLKNMYGVITHFYIDDSSGKTRSLYGKSIYNIHYAPDPKSRVLSWLLHWVGFMVLLFSIKPNLIEVYTSRHPLLLIPMVVSARFLLIPSVCICRGELNPSVYGNRSRIAKKSLVLLLKLSNAILYKEPYMRKILDSVCTGSPKFFWHNSVLVEEEPRVERVANRVLFLNRLIPMRNVELVIRAARIVADVVPDVEFIIGGKTSHLIPNRGLGKEGREHASQIRRYEDYLEEMVVELDVGGYVHILPFVDNVRPLYDCAKIFILPANTVFCNYALLEAMERSVPAIVSDEVDPYAGLIIQDGVNGRLVPLEADAIAQSIIGLLQNEELRQSLGHAARDTIKNKFNLRFNLGCIYNIYSKLLMERNSHAN